MTKYRWSNVYEWFEDYINRLVSEGNIDEIASIAKQFALQDGDDAIRHFFESKMVKDGFFKQDKEEFIEQLRNGIKQLPAYQADNCDEEDESQWIDLEEWLNDIHAETFDSLYESHDTAEEAIAYLRN